MKEAVAQVDDRQLDKLQAIVRGMTPAERADPKIINGSRRLRIANGIRRRRSPTSTTWSPASSRPARR